MNILKRLLRKYQFGTRLPKETQVALQSLAKSKGDLKYYIYLSPSKVDMLFSQISMERQSKIEKELAIDLKLVKMSFSKKQYVETLYSKLSVVVKYLEEVDGIGDIFSPKDYFRGSLRMEWAQIYPGVAFWGGKSNNIAIGLGGSMNHILGYETKEVEKKGISHTPWLVAALSQEVESIIRPSTTEPQDFINDGSDEYERRVLASTYSWADNLSWRSYQKFDFIAKKLRYTDYQQYRLLLGTPLYVASIEK